MKRIWLSLIAAGLLTVAAFAPVAAQDVLTLPFDEVDESGISGTIRISSENGQSVVAILITAGLEDGAVHPVHIHDGTCDDLGGVAYPLDDIVDGASETTIDAELSELLEGEYAINAHLSSDEMATWVACADIADAEPEEADDEVEADDEAVDDEEDDDAVEDVVPAAGSTGGVSTDTAVVMLVLVGGAMLGTGVLIRRRSVRLSA